MFTLPPGFVTIVDAFKTVDTDRQCNVIAVVVDHLDSAKSRRDWMIKVTLHDHSAFPGIGAPFRFFNAEEARLPAIGSNGDVLIIRNMKVKDFGGVAGITNRSTEWAVIDTTSLATSTDETFSNVKFTQSMNHILGPPTTAELLYAKQILEMTDTSTIQQPAKPTSLHIANIITANGGTAPPTQHRKFSLIKDLMPSTGPHDMVFKDVLGEVRRIWKSDSRMSIYLTDYTSHELLYGYSYGRADEAPDGDAFGYVKEATRTWPGPHGKFTIQITLWDANAQFAHLHLQEGNYVLVKNVHITMDRNGSTMEGHCRGDKMNMTKVNVIIVKPVEIDGNEQLRELVKRKRAIDKAEGPRFVSDPTNLKRRAEAIAKAGEEATLNSKAARNKKLREKRKSIKRQGNTRDTDGVQDSDDSVSKSKFETTSRYSMNSEIRTLNVAVPPKPIHEILDREILARVTPNGNPFYLPFQNCKYKSQVRVVDFFPNDIADFAAPYRESDFDLLLDEEEEDEEEADIDEAQLDDADIKWEWRFVLLVEDATRPPGQPPARMELLVADDGGDYLFDMEACNLNKNHHKLTELKDKLFVLWGDLQELKAEAGDGVTEFKPRARPFQCLIKEYGIEARDDDGVKIGRDEYERIFRLWGTRVT